MHSTTDQPIPERAHDPFVIPLRTCTPWCSDGDGHPGLHPVDRRCWSDDAQVPHSLGEAVEFQERFELPRITVGLVRQPNATDAQVIFHDEGADHEIYLTPVEAIAVADALRAKVDLLRTPEWWSTVHNPPCRPWCTKAHAEGEFAQGGLFFCETDLQCASPAVESVTVSAIVCADETPGATAGALRWDPPDVEVYMLADGRDGEVTTPEALEALMRELPPVLAEARKIAASDEYATDEQRAAVIA